VLPDHFEHPAVVRQDDSVSAVALDVPFKLWEPVVQIRLRQHSVAFAAMPEAPAKVDGHSLAREDDVRTKTETSDDLPVLAKAEPATMQLGTESTLGSRVR
jgi:hypothetical protein